MLNGNGLAMRWMVMLQIVSVVAAVLLAYATMSARWRWLKPASNRYATTLQNLRDYVKAMEDRRRE